MLREQFFAKLDEPMAPPRERWHEIWQLLVIHPWVLAELKKYSKRVLYLAGAPKQWAEDLQEDVIVLLAKRLGHAPDLHVDRARAAEQFSGWLATIIEHACQDALRHMRSGHREVALDARGESRLSVEDSAAEALDLRSAMDGIPDSIRTVIELYLRGLRLHEIASRLGLTFWQVRRAFRRGKALLAQMLNGRRGER
jgi:RNA polymerase sigma factor (sigma-70 family)